jgi:rhodanese-related sulfurtransferase
MALLGKSSLETRLAVIALLLGIGAIFGHINEGETLRIHPQELAAMVETEIDHVDVRELADWVMQSKTDYRLIDVRDPVSYAEYHVPTAENVGITDLIDYPLRRTEKIVLYSNDGLHSAQAWFLLKAKGYPGVYILFGGLRAWKDEILFPTLAADATADEIATFEERRFVSNFFGGTPRTGGTDAEIAAVTMPKVEAPPVTPAAPRKRRTKEGC